MTNLNDPSQATPAWPILNRLRGLWTAQEKTHEQVLQNGDGIRKLQVLLDLFRHPGTTVNELAQTLEATLDALQRSATQMIDGITRSNAFLTSLQSEADRRDKEIAHLMDLVRSQQADLTYLRTEFRHLSHYLGHDPAPKADDA